MSAPGRGFANLLDRCLAVREGERVVLLRDEGTDDAVVAELVAGIELRRATSVVVGMPVPRLPGRSPRDVAAAMLEAGAVIELTSLFIGSSMARRRATEAGVRYLAMPGVRLETFETTVRSRSTSMRSGPTRRRSAQRGTARRSSG